MDLLYTWINSLSKHYESAHTSYWSALPIFYGPVIFSSLLAVSERSCNNFSSVYARALCVLRACVHPSGMPGHNLYICAWISK